VQQRPGARALNLRNASEAPKVLQVRVADLLFVGCAVRNHLQRSCKAFVKRRVN
jgi:hypothetical protein